jgi:trans-feruloyl-CoA hydratase/vanillin synthase
MSARDAMLYIMTGRTFDGRQAAAMGVVNWSTPRERLREEVEALARELLAKSPAALHAAKVGFRYCRELDWDLAEDYLYAKLEQSRFLDREDGRGEGLRQFLDEKRIRPGLETYVRDA